MTQMKFLYGAAVQGIQSFIFQTNALRHIAGASELVEQICTRLFAEAIGCDEEKLKSDPNAIVTAAGNIKYVFGDDEIFRNLVLTFPKKVMEFAPGVTISQAVVKVDDGEIEKKHVDELERRLRVQRNKPNRPFDIGLIAMKRSRKTGLPAVEYSSKENDYLDLGVVRKNEAVESEDKDSPVYGRIVKDFFGSDTRLKLALDFKLITKSRSKQYSWLAVVHADGNNMGLALQKLAVDTSNLKGHKFIEIFREFSLALDASTKAAAKAAYEKVMEGQPTDPGGYPPFRPIVIGGDDLTIVCRGDLALEFTKLFLESFNVETKERFSKLPVKIDFLSNGLTACAGIAYIKESYPFHYGYHLAETLCVEAKKAAKEGSVPNEITPSCLMFHKVQDSFVEDFKEIRKRELCAGEGDNRLRFDFGPYYIDQAGKPGIEDLIIKVSRLEGKEGNVIKSHLRQWLSDMHNEPGLAEQKKLRIISMKKDQLKSLGLAESKNWIEIRSMETGSASDQKFTPVYDWLTIHSINQGGE